MRLAIMQPYFFPYLGHFSLIAACDQWIVFDITQYTPKTWMNRNRILHPAGGAKWLTVPLANSSIHIRTHQAALLDPAGLRGCLLPQLSHYRRAPFYRPVIDLLDRVLTTPPSSLARLNVRALEAVCGYLGLPFRYRICSELRLALPPDLGPGGWAPEIAAALGADEYVNPAGGRALFDPDRFRRNGVALNFLHSQAPTYATPGFAFQPNLSVLDALMWNDPPTVLAAVRTFKIERADTSVFHAGPALAA